LLRVVRVQCARQRLGLTRVMTSSAVPWALYLRCMRASAGHAWKRDTALLIQEHRANADYVSADPATAVPFVVPKVPRMTR
jgi:hypothetical protein